MIFYYVHPQDLLDILLNYFFMYYLNLYLIFDLILYRRFIMLVVKLMILFFIRSMYNLEEIFGFRDLLYRLSLDFKGLYLFLCFVFIGIRSMIHFIHILIYRF